MRNGKVLKPLIGLSITVVDFVSRNTTKTAEGLIFKYDTYLNLPGDE